MYKAGYNSFEFSFAHVKIKNSKLEKGEMSLDTLTNLPVSGMYFIRFLVFTNENVLILNT